jgi:hypothetical protein
MFMRRYDGGEVSFMEEKQNTGESGVLVLEATFGFFITIVVMLFLLSIGLLLYQ